MINEVWGFWHYLGATILGLLAILMWIQNVKLKQKIKELEK